MALNADVVEGVTAANFKVMAESATVSLNLATMNATAHQNRMNILAEAIVGGLAKSISEVDVSEALGLVGIGQQVMKGAQTTPPPTTGI